MIPANREGMDVAAKARPPPPREWPIPMIVLEAGEGEEEGE